jgi:hypothetical protein
VSSESNAQVLEEKMVLIKGTDDWTNTNIRLYPKDKVTIKATGDSCFSTQYCNDASVNADGWNQESYCDDWPGDCMHCDDPLMTVNHAALIGNVGNDDFFIGKEAKFSGKDGFLYIGINDCTLTENYPNSGQFEVFISVKHIK